MMVTMLMGIVQIVVAVAIFMVETLKYFHDGSQSGAVVLIAIALAAGGAADLGRPVVPPLR